MALRNSVAVDSVSSFRICCYPVGGGGGGGGGREGGGRRWERVELL